MEKFHGMPVTLIDKKQYNTCTLTNWKPRKVHKTLSKIIKIMKSAKST